MRNFRKKYVVMTLGRTTVYSLPFRKKLLLRVYQQSVKEMICGCTHPE